MRTEIDFFYTRLFSGGAGLYILSSQIQEEARLRKNLCSIPLQGKGEKNQGLFQA
jgi:hypothetical protein